MLRLCLSCPVCQRWCDNGVAMRGTHAGFPGVNSEFQELVKACAEAALETNDSKLKTKVSSACHKACNTVYPSLPARHQIPLRPLPDPSIHLHRLESKAPLDIHITIWWMHCYVSITFASLDIPLSNKTGTMHYLSRQSVVLHQS